MDTLDARQKTGVSFHCRGTTIRYQQASIFQPGGPRAAWNIVDNPEVIQDFVG